jgi:hypothetical protein
MGLNMTHDHRDVAGLVDDIQRLVGLEQGAQAATHERMSGVSALVQWLLAGGAGSAVFAADDAF